MNKLITVLSLVLFLFAPTIAAQNSSREAIIDRSAHYSEFCLDEMNCTQATHQCCVSHTFVSFYFLERVELIRFSPVQRSAYIQYNVPLLKGVKRPFYRPPIL